MVRTGAKKNGNDRARGCRETVRVYRVDKVVGDLKGRENGRGSGRCLG